MSSKEAFEQYKGTAPIHRPGMKDAFEAGYLAGRNDQKQKDAKICDDIEDDYLEGRIFDKSIDMTQAAAACGTCRQSILNQGDE